MQQCAFHLDPEIAKAARYGPRQIGKSDASYATVHTSRQRQPDERVSLRVLSLLDLYIETLHSRALLELLERMPLFGEVAFEDGDRLGERRLIFTQNQSEEACDWLTYRMWKHSSDPSVAVGPRMRTCLRNVSWKKEPDKMLLAYVSDAEITSVVVDRVVADLQVMSAPNLGDQNERRFPWETVRKRLVCLSQPELVFLHWEEARRPAGPLEETLWQAVETANMDGIIQALQAGADPNHLSRYGSTPLATLIESYGNLWMNAQDQREGKDISHYPTVEQLLEMTDQMVAYGADVNLAGPKGSSALLEAAYSADVRLVERLLDHDGKPDERDPTEHPGTLSMWDAAYRRCDGMDEDHHDTTVLDLLTARYGERYL